jgi:hypothetical protein
MKMDSKLDSSASSLQTLCTQLTNIHKIEKPKGNNPFANLAPGTPPAVQVLETKLEALRTALYASSMAVVDEIKREQGRRWAICSSCCSCTVNRENVTCAPYKHHSHSNAEAALLGQSVSPAPSKWRLPRLLHVAA